MKPALRMPEEMTRSALDYQTLYMNWDCVDYSPQSKTRADMQGKSLLCKSTRRTSSRDWGSVHCGPGLQCL